MFYILALIIIYHGLASNGHAEQRSVSGSILSKTAHNNVTAFNRENNINTTKPGFYHTTRFFTEFDDESIVGGGTQFDFYYRYPFINNGGKLFRSTKLDIGIQEFLTPAFNRVSAFIKIEPIAFFDLKARFGYDYIYDFLAMDSPDSNYSSETRDNIPRESLHPKSGFRSDITPTFKFAIGPVALLYSFNWTFHNYGYSGYYYDYNTFIIHKGTDSFFRHDLKIMYKLGDFRIGPQFVYSEVYSSGKNTQKAALIVACFPGWKWLNDTTKPFFALIGGTYLKNRYSKHKPITSIALGINIILF
jgi:hypothetical protein